MIKENANSIKANQTEAFIMEFPLPDRRLSPNARTHWRALSRLRKHTRRMVCDYIMACGYGNKRWGQAEASIVLYYQTARRRDIDNAVASLKAHFDGMVCAIYFTS